MSFLVLREGNYMFQKVIRNGTRINITRKTYKDQVKINFLFKLFDDQENIKLYYELLFGGFKENLVLVVYLYRQKITSSK